MLFRLWLCVSVLVVGSVYGQTPAPIEPATQARAANVDVTYLALRKSLPGGDGVNVQGFTLAREGGIFHFEQGNFYLYAPVDGRVTGAVFLGKGHFDLSPKDVSEQHSLARLTNSGVMSQDFSTLVLRFTDGTADEIRKASLKDAGIAPNQAVQAGAELAKSFRMRLHENVELRLLEDILSKREGGFFVASFHMGGIFTGHNVLFVVDPEGPPNVAPDQVELMTWSEEDLTVWTAYRMQQDAGEAAGIPIHVTNEKLDVTFERSGTMQASAETTLTVHRGGLRVVRLNLYPTLRVSGVFNESGQPLDFVQENKDNDPDFAVLLPEATKAGQSLRLLTKYGGADAVRRDGDDVYYLQPGARESWYPAGGEGLGAFSNFQMTFHLPARLQIVATGKEVSRVSEEHGGTRVTWVTSTPIPVAGFNLGNFKSREAKTPRGFTVDAYANANLPDALEDLSRGADLGTMSTVPALNAEVGQGSAAIQVYSDYFGKLPFDHIALTQQSACDFGQSWPMLVYLPICGFWDSTVQERLGLLDSDRSYWKEVTPHEVSHQWWGQTVGFSSYRDQWMSEGFANFSVSLYLMETSKNMEDYREFWNEQRTDLLRKNAKGMRPIDVGPLTMGYRVSNEKAGEDVYQMLIYSKGAFVLHMLQMMYWTPGSGEALFKQTMQQFVSKYSGKAATTEDLKTTFEHTMPKRLDLRGDGKLDWFFDEYVYGTEVPHYAVNCDFTDTNGDTVAHFRVTQSGVSNSFIMLVPIYLQLENGTTARIANLTLHGDAVIDHTMNLGKLPSPAKKLLVNYNADVLSD